MAGRKPPASHRRDDAYLNRSGKDGGRARNKRLAAGGRYAVCEKRAQRRARRGRLLAARGRGCTRGMRQFLSDRNAGHTLLRRRGGRPEAGNNACSRPPARLGLHSGRQTDNRRTRPCRRIQTLCRGLCGVSRGQDNPTSPNIYRNMTKSAVRRKQRWKSQSKCKSS